MGNSLLQNFINQKLFLGDIPPNCFRAIFRTHQECKNINKADLLEPTEETVKLSWCTAHIMKEIAKKKHYKIHISSAAQVG